MFMPVEWRLYIKPQSLCNGHERLIVRKDFASSSCCSIIAARRKAKVLKLNISPWLKVSEE